MFRNHFNVNLKTLQIIYGSSRYSTRITVNESEPSLNATPIVNEPKPFESIPGLPVVPYLGSSWLSIPYIGRYDRTRFHESVYQIYTEYGKLVREQFREIKLVWVFDANDAETVFRNEGKLPRRDGFDAMKLYRKLRPNYYSSGGLLLVQGEEWYNFRTKTQQYLLKPKLIHNYIPVMNEIANEMIQRIVTLSSQNDSRIDDFVKELYRWALESIGVVALDQRLGCLAINSGSQSSSPEQIIECVSDIILCSGILDLQVMALWRIFRRPLGKHWRKFIAANDKFTEIVMQYINEARERLKNKKELSTHSEKSILELLLSRSDFTPAEAVTMTLDMFLAGIDTTSHSFIYALYFIGKDKRIQEEARKEVKAIIGDTCDINEEQINELHYLKACIKESQRLMPVVFANFRILNTDVVLSGYRVPRRTLIGIGHYVMGRMEEYYSDPLTYKPERWIKSNPGSGSRRVYSEEIHPFATLPFGYGPRMCIGRRIALQEQLILLSKLMQNFEIGFDGNELRMLTTAVTKPDKPLTFTFKRLLPH